MYSVAVIACIFWYTDECQLGVIEELQYSIPTVEGQTSRQIDGLLVEITDTNPNGHPGDSIPIVEVEAIQIDGFLVRTTDTNPNGDSASPGEMSASHRPRASYAYDSYQYLSSIDFVNSFFQDDEPEIGKQTVQQHVNKMPYLNQNLLAGQKPSPTDKDDDDVRMAQMYFKQMLGERQQKITTSSAPNSFLGKFDKFTGQACSLGNDEHLARFEIGLSISNFDPSGCAQACLSVTACTGFQINQFRTNTVYCDLLSTCTKDHLQVASGSELSTYLLTDNNIEDATPSFYYYYDSESDFGFIIPTLFLLGLLCFVLAICRIKRRKQIMLRRLQARLASKRDTVRGTPFISNKREDSPDDDVIVIGHRVMTMSPEMKKVFVDEGEEQEF